MKYLKFMSILLLFCLGLTSCDDLLGEKEEKEDREPNFFDYVDFKVNKCERIGSVLIVDFTAKNKTKGTLRNILLNGGSVFNMCRDNLGNTYYSYISLIGGSYSESKLFSLQKDESTNGRFRIGNFDPTNKATKIDLKFAVSIESEGLSNNITCPNIRITDNRVTANGFQTPDDNLEVKLVSSSRDKNKKEAYITFTVKNTSNENISNLSISPSAARDNTGLNYSLSGYRCLKISNGNYQSSVTRTIAAGETVSYTLGIPNVENNATAISGSLWIDSNNYTLCDNYIRFYDIQLQ